MSGEIIIDYYSIAFCHYPQGTHVDVEQEAACGSQGSHDG